MDHHERPFSYITEDNVKRLAHLFILRKSDPWLIAAVASLLRPDCARRMIDSLPFDLQAKVTIESLNPNPLTREQEVAMDSDIMESMGFVVGGVARLAEMLELADTDSRDNILEYLKARKPLVYGVLRGRLPA